MAIVGRYPQASRDGDGGGDDGVTAYYPRCPKSYEGQKSTIDWNPH